MMIDKDFLTNQIHAGLEDVNETGIPLDVFPDAIQKIVYELVTYENFNLEYTTSIVLSVFATAIGNALRVNIKGEWVSSCALYMILVGRPGLGKTPPLKFLYSPIRDFDQQMLDNARQDYELYKQQHLGKKGEDSSEQADKPRLTQTVISDFTQEAMLSVHYDNPRGITLVVDEIIALFNSVKRYSAKSNLIQDLLSAYSGTPLKAVRKTEEFPLTIPVPCINIIGSIQTGLLSDVMTKEYVANGLIDRFLFVFPKNRKIPEWQIGIDDKQRPATMSKWISIIRKVIDIPCPVKEDDSTVVPSVLKMSEDAANYFISWNNSIIGAINAIEDDNEVESRKMKLNGNAARLALILQVMRWSVGECQLNCIDIESVKGAIRFVEYFEDCYNRVKASCDMECPNAKQDDWLELVGSTFTAHEAEMAGERLGISRRTVYNSLKRLSSSDHPLLRRVKQGVYEKIVYESTTAQCTFAQPMDGADENNEVHSAKVQIRQNLKRTVIKRIAMSNYRFHLEKYHTGSKLTCPNCKKPRCFVRYIDEQGKIHIPNYVGRCDHEHSCRYHYTPKDYFHDHPEERPKDWKDDYVPIYNKVRDNKPKEMPKPLPPSTISYDIVRKSMAKYAINPLFAYLCGVFGEKETRRLFQLYHVGTSYKWGGCAVFWQIDINDQVRTGKLMAYDRRTGHRIKEQSDVVSWAHAELKVPGYHLVQCLFGEHFLPSKPNAPVALVESEKTAIIMTHYMSDLLWLATGGKDGCFNENAVRVLQGRTVILIPDLGAWEHWQMKSQMLLPICKSVKISDVIEKIASEEQREKGLDIADFILMKPNNREILAGMIRRNSAVKLLIDTFDLELCEDEDTNLSQPP